MYISSVVGFLPFFSFEYVALITHLYFLASLDWNFAVYVSVLGFPSTCKPSIFCSFPSSYTSNSIFSPTNEFSLSFKETSKVISFPLSLNEKSLTPIISLQISTFTLCAILSSISITFPIFSTISSNSIS